jgi:hypothetical protein
VTLKIRHDGCGGLVAAFDGAAFEFVHDGQRVAGGRLRPRTSGPRFGGRHRWAVQLELSTAIKYASYGAGVIDPCCQRCGARVELSDVVRAARQGVARNAGSVKVRDRSTAQR